MESAGVVRKGRRRDWMGLDDHPVPIQPVPPVPPRSRASSPHPVPGGTTMRNLFEVSGGAVELPTGVLRTIAAQCVNKDHSQKQRAKTGVSSGCELLL